MQTLTLDLLETMHDEHSHVAVRVGRTIGCAPFDEAEAGLVDPFDDVDRF